MSADQDQQRRPNIMTGGDYDPALRAATADPEDRMPGYFVGGGVDEKRGVRQEIKRDIKKVGEKAEEAV